MNMKKIIKKLIASICTATLIVGSLSTLGAASDANSSSESSALSTIAYKHVTTSSFYQGDEQMPDYVQVDGGEGAEAADTVATYATVKDMQGNVISNHHKTLLSLKVQFENDTSSYRTRLEVAGAVDDTGFRMYPEVGKLRLEGIGGIQSDASVFRIATDPLTSFAEEFILQMSFEYGDFDGDSESNDVKVGVYINGALGTTNYETGNAAVADNHAIFYDCDLTKLGTYMKLYTESDASACDLSVAAYVPESTNLTEVTWSDFNLILNGTETPAVDKEFTSTDTADHVASTYILNREGVEKFENTSVELEVKFNTDGGADKMYFGGSGTWYGVMLYPTGSGNLALVNNTSLSPDFGLTEEALYFEPTVAKLTDKTFLNHEFVMKITTEYGDYDGDGASDDAQLGFYFDGNLYNNQYCYVNNYKSSDLTGNYIAIDAGNGVTVKSVVDTARVATADVTGVYKGSSNGQVKLALDAVGSVALPTSATYSNISVNVSDGTTATDYRVDGTLTDGILSLDLTDKIVADATNVITVQAGTYTGMNANAKAYLKLEEDFVCYQDKSSGSVYQKLGSTTLEVGQNFNGGTPADGDLYLVGTDLTGELQGFTEGYTSAGGEWWTIYLTPLNEESGVFRQSEGGESVRMTTEDYYVKYPTEGNIQYYIFVGDHKADGDVFTIKGQFQVVKDGNYYKDYQNVIDFEEVQYEYNQGLWRKYTPPVELEQPDESFKKITFSHFNIKDNTYVNSGKDEFQAEGSAKLSLNKTLLCGKIRLEDGHNYDIRYGGKDSIWYGLFIDVTQYGSWHAYWIDSNGALQGPLVSMDSDIAGTALFGSTLDFMLSTEIIDADGDGKENDIQFGFWFEDVLYNNEYIVVKDKADELGSKLGIMAKGEGTTVTINSIADLVEPVDPETIVTLNENFKKITFSHFGIEDDTYKYTGSGFSAMGKYRDSLDKTVFSGDVFIPEGSKFTLRYGGNEHAWYGLTFNIEERGVLHLAWIDDDGVKYLVTDISSSKAQTQLFNKWLNIKVSSEIIDADKDGKKDDIRFGIWFNDIPYKEEYVIVYDKAANLGSYFGVVCDTEGTYLKIRSIAELVEPFNYEAYGLTKDWEKTLLNTGLTSDIPIGGSRESGPYSGDFSNIGKVLAMVTLGAAGIVFCIFERKRKKGSLSNI